MAKNSKPNVIKKTNEYAAEFSSGIEEITDRVHGANRLDNIVSTDSKNKRKKFEDLTFTDDFMFRKVLRRNEDLCRRVVELLLDVEIDRIEYLDDDHIIEESYESKSVRLDVYLKDDRGTVFELEMQNGNEDPLPRRSRYYQSMIDVENLEKGKSYKKLPESYVIFITKFDPFKAGLHKYEFRELCLQDTEIELGSGTSKVFINASSVEKEMTAEMRKFLDFLCGRDPESDLTKGIASAVEKVKADKKIRRQYMFLSEMMSEEYEKGSEQRGYDAVDRLVADGKYNIREACSILGVDYDAYMACRAEKEKNRSK